MVMSMNSMNGYGYGSQVQSNSSNIPQELKAKHGYEFDFRQRPQIVSTPIDIIPKAPKSKIRTFLQRWFS